MMVVNRKGFYTILFSVLVFLLSLGSLSSCATSIQATETISHSTPTSVVPPTPSPLPVFQEAVQQTEELPLINPLTGLSPDLPENLERRPIVVKVENLPRNSRPQWGLSLADIIFEYHTEEGTTRFAAVFYGNNAEKVGPVRSARLFDIQIVEMFKAILVFGSAYQAVLEQLAETSFADRLVVEGPYTSSALQRYDPEGKNYLLLNTYRLGEVIDFYDIDNQPQDLSGMIFDIELPEGGHSAESIFVRYSGAIYNRWDYDVTSGRYLRFCDAEDDVNRTHEVYEQLFDRLTGEPIAADNLVMILAENYVVQPNIYDVKLTGEGEAFLARDGYIYPVFWRREHETDLLTLWDAEGEPVPFKPGNTWYEILSLPAIIQQEEEVWRFIFQMPE